MVSLSGSHSGVVFSALALVSHAFVASAGALPRDYPIATATPTPAPVLPADECSAYRDGSQKCYTHTVFEAAEPCPYTLCPNLVNQCRAEWLLESLVIEVPCQNKCCPTTATQTVKTACQACPTACEPVYTHVEYAYPTSCAHDMSAIAPGSAADLMVNAVHGPSLPDLTYVLAKRMAEEEDYNPAEDQEAEEAEEEHHHPKPFPPLRPPPHHHKPPPNQPGIVITTKPVFTIPTWAPNLPTMVTLTHATHASRMMARAPGHAVPHKFVESNGPFEEEDHSPAENLEGQEAQQADEENHHPQPFPPLRPPPHHHKPPPHEPGIVITTKPVFTIPTWAPNLPTMVTLTHATHASRIMDGARDSAVPEHVEDPAAGTDQPGRDVADVPPPLGTATPTQRLSHHPVHGEPPLAPAQTV